MNSYKSLCICLLLLCSTYAFTFSCGYQEMEEYQDTVVFTCQFSENVRIMDLLRIHVPNLISITPNTTESSSFEITAYVEEYSLGTITLFLAEGAFGNDEEVSDEYSIDFNYDFIYTTVKVRGYLQRISEHPGRAFITISGGNSVKEQIQGMNDIAQFPNCIDILSVKTTELEYIVDVYIWDYTCIEEETYTVMPNNMYAYWGKKTNMRRELPFNVLHHLDYDTNLVLWPKNNVIYVTSEGFQYSTDAFRDIICSVDSESFSAVNVKIFSVVKSNGTVTITGQVLNTGKPASLTFIGYTPNTCVYLSYPASVNATATILVEQVPSAEYSYKIGENGCANYLVEFSAPVSINDMKSVVITSASGIPAAVTENHIKQTPTGLYMGISGSACVTMDSDTLTLSLKEHSVHGAAGSEVSLPSPIEFYVSRLSLFLALNTTIMPTPNYDNIYVYRNTNGAFVLKFESQSELDINACEYESAFKFDNNMDVSISTTANAIIVTGKMLTIDYHTIHVDISKLKCSGSIPVEIYPTVVQLAHDPAFLPGDIIITRVNSYYSPEFDFVPLRKVYTWNKIFFTDSGYASPLLGFIDHGSDGCISWTPKTDVESGNVIQWSYVAMTHALDRSIPRIIDINYAFNYEQHGFLLDFQDNLFIYVTGNGDSNSRYDDDGTRTFLFGVYWSSSEWAAQTNNYMDITSEYSALPDELINYSIALGIAATPVPRGVNYMSIKQSNFNAYANTKIGILEKITTNTNWETSQKDRFTMSPQVSYMEYPMKIKGDIELDSSETMICMAFYTPFTVQWDKSKLFLTFLGLNVPFVVIVREKDYCLRYSRPTTEGELVFVAHEGAFYYVSESVIPITYKMQPAMKSFDIFNTPLLTVDFQSSPPYQHVTITSSIPCDTWGMVETHGSVMYVISEGLLSATYGFAGQYGSYFVLPAGFCTTAGGRTSLRYVSTTINVEVVNPKRTYPKNLFSTVNKFHTPEATVVFKVEPPSAGWTFDRDTVFYFAGSVGTSSMNYFTNQLTIQFFVTFTENGEYPFVLPQGTFVKNDALSAPVDTLVSFLNQPIDVSTIKFPWETIDYRHEQVQEMDVNFEFDPTYGSLDPSIIVELKGSCRTVGYILREDTTVTVTTSVLHGMCNYGFATNGIKDSYGNVNDVYQKVIKFDFHPPEGLMLLFSNPETLEAEDMNRIYFNYEPVVGILFDEPISDFDFRTLLIDTDNCDIAYHSYSVLPSEMSLLRYTLSNCMESSINITVVPGILIKDIRNNTIFSEDSITNSYFIFYDHTRPTIVLESDTKFITGDEITVRYIISEDLHDFSCNDIVVAVDDVQSTVSVNGENSCLFSFNPAPVNGTRIIFMVPENRFHDISGNGNIASNILSPFVFNRGAVINLDIPRYTDQVQTGFTVTIDYTWLCPNYEYIFPSTMEYDRDIARIEKLGGSVIVDGRITQTFAVTFYNFNSYPEEHYKDFAIHIPSYACHHPLHVHNSVGIYYTTFDFKPTQPVIAYEGGVNEIYSFTATFNDVKRFGELEPIKYISAHYVSDDVTADCTAERSQTEKLFAYYLHCPFAYDGYVNVTVHRGAIVEHIGVMSPEFSRILYVNAQPPAFALSTSTPVFSPTRNSITVLVEHSMITEPIAPSCFMTDNPDVSIIVTLNSLLSSINTNVTVILASHPYYIHKSTFSIYIKENCTTDMINGVNNRKSNELILGYDFTAPVISISCGEESTVLNTYSFSGSFDKECMPLTSDNFVIPDDCYLRSVNTIYGMNFTAKVTCINSGTYSFYLQNVEDIYGNIASESSACSATFIIDGPSILYTIQNLIRETYVNTNEFAIDVYATESCYTMNLSDQNVVGDNTFNRTYEQIDACHWVVRGYRLEEGLVFVRILDGAAVDIYGGISLSRTVTFRSYQSLPTVFYVVPTVVEANSVKEVSINFDWDILQVDATKIVAENGCSSVVVKKIRTTFIDMTVTFTSESKCYLHLLEGFVTTRWLKNNEDRYVIIDVDTEPPKIQMNVYTSKKEESLLFDTGTVTTQNIYVNSDFFLEVIIPRNVEIHSEKLVLPTESCIQSILVDQSNGFLITAKYDSISTSCQFNLVFGEGFFVDSFSRKSEQLVAIVGMNRQALLYSVPVEPYYASNPVSICLEFSQPIVLKDLAIVSTASSELFVTEKCPALLRLYPQSEDTYTFYMSNIHSIYGNSVATSPEYSFVYYDKAPVIERITGDRVISSLGSSHKATVSIIASQDMKIVGTTINDFFTIEEKEVIDMMVLESVVVDKKMITMVFAPHNLPEGRTEYVLQGKRNAIQNAAGTPIAEIYSITIIADNAAPVVSDISIKGGKKFSVLPVETTLTFSKPVIVELDAAGYVTAVLNEQTIHFEAIETLDSLVPVGSLTLRSKADEIVDFQVGDEMVYSVAFGIGKDVLENKVASNVGSKVIASNGIVSMVGEPSYAIVAGKPLATMIFNTPITHIVEEEISGDNAEIESIAFEDEKVIIAVSCKMQGPWYMIFRSSALIGSDSGRNTENYIISGVYDSVAPTIRCDIPSAASNGTVIVSCTFSERLRNADALMTVTLDDMVLDHEELRDDETMSLVVSFVAVEEYIPEYSNSAYISVDTTKCLDMYGNGCVPARYRLLIDMTSVNIFAIPEHRFVENGEIAKVVIASSKYLATNLKYDDLVITYPEHAGVYEFVEFTTGIENYMYALTFKVSKKEGINEIIPFTVTIPAGVVEDIVGNLNNEVSVDVYINEIPPVVSATVVKDTEKSYTATVVFTDGPVSVFTADMIEVSNAEITEIKSVSSTELTNTYEVLFTVPCDATCDYALTLQSSKIFDDAGNQLPEDYPIQGIAEMKPVVTFDTKTYCGTLFCNIQVVISENVDFNCNKIVTSSSSFGPISTICYNTALCICRIRPLDESKMGTFEFSLPANSVFTSRRIGNDETQGKIVYYSPFPTSIDFVTQWQPGDSIFHIPFSARNVAPNSKIPQSAVLCQYCVIDHWEETYIFEYYIYTFEVSFVNDLDRYARVYVPENSVKNVLNKYNKYSEYVLRVVEDAPVVLDFSYTPLKEYSLFLQFDREVEECGGKVYLISAKQPERLVRIPQTFVHIDKKRVLIDYRMNSNTQYQLFWEPNAFCDHSHLPSNNECSMCTFMSVKGIPLPPTELHVEDVSESSAKIYYSGVENGGYPLTGIIAVTSYGINDSNPHRYSTSESSGYFVIENLVPNMHYMAILLSVNDYGMSKPSKAIAFDTLPVTPKPAYDLRVCNLIDPVDVDGITKYTKADACWNAVDETNVIYRLRVKTYKHSLLVNEYTAYEGPNRKAEFSIPNDILDYELLVDSISVVDVVGPKESTIVKAFVTEIDLQDSKQFPQGKNIIVNANRVSRDSIMINFNHPLENYFRIEKYMVQYGNVFDIYYEPTDRVFESYPFLYDKCLGSSVTVTVRALVHGSFWGLPSQQITVSCSQPKLYIYTEGHYDFASFRVLSEMKMDATCTLFAASSRSIIASIDVSVDTNESGASYLFKSLDADTDYIIECSGYDIENEIVSGSATFFTMSTYVPPAMELKDPELAITGSYFVKVPVKSVTAPGTAYCVATTLDDLHTPTRSQYLRDGYSTYVYPGMYDMYITITRLTPNTSYQIRCLFEPDYTEDKIIHRRLNDDPYVITTASEYKPEWIDLTPYRDSIVAVNEPVILTALMPIDVYEGHICFVSDDDRECLLPSLSYFSIEKNVAKVYHDPFVPGKEYCLETTLGVFVDAATLFPLPAITKDDELCFTISVDETIISPPAVVLTVPEEGSVSDLINMSVAFVFDRMITLVGNEYSITVNGVKTYHYSGMSVVGAQLTIETDVFLPPHAKVTVKILRDLICNLYGAYGKEDFTLSFTVGNHDFEPSLVSISPANGAKLIPAGEDITLLFNKEIVIREGTVFSFVADTGKVITIDYSEEQVRSVPRIVVKDNMIRVSGSALPGGYTYTILYQPTSNSIIDKEGRAARGIPTVYTIGYSVYYCSGEYIQNDMSSECSCFMGVNRCECWCGEPETPMDVVIRLMY